MLSTGFARAVFTLLCLACLACTAAGAEDRAYSFNVLNHRSVALTAQQWNPILLYVSEKSGVQLELNLNRKSQESTAKAESGAYDFIYSNHFFTAARERLGFRVIARPAGPGIRGQLVVLHDSPVTKLTELEGQQVAFASREAFTGYSLPMDTLLNAGVTTQPVFTGDAEASIGLLRRGEVAAAGVNSSVVERMGRRSGFRYRVLWSSKIYPDLAVMAHPRVPAAKVAAVRAALIGMVNDPRGRKILETGAELLKMEENALGFVAAENRDYDAYRAFYRQMRVKP